MKRGIYALVAVVGTLAFLACGAAAGASYVRPMPAPKHAPFLDDGRWAAGVDQGSVWAVQTVRSIERRPAPWLCSMPLLRLEAYTMTIMPGHSEQAHFDVRTGKVSLWALAAPAAVVAAYARWRFGASRRGRRKTSRA